MFGDAVEEVGGARWGKYAVVWLASRIRHALNWSESFEGNKLSCCMALEEATEETQEVKVQKRNAALVNYLFEENMCGHSRCFSYSKRAKFIIWTQMWAEPTQLRFPQICWERRMNSRWFSRWLSCMYIYFKNSWSVGHEKGVQMSLLLLLCRYITFHITRDQHP